MSAKSDKFERDVAEGITTMWKGLGLIAERPSVGTQYSDVRLKYKNKHYWMEVKMNHTDNLANPRVFYNGNKWNTTYKTGAASTSIKLLNEKRGITKSFHTMIDEYTDIDDAKVPTTKGGLKDPEAVPLESMRSFFDDKVFKSRYILERENVNIAKIVIDHYTKGKAEPAYYLQAADDFYLVGPTDPLGLNKGLSPKIPVISGMGDFRVRVSTRSRFYEVQAEIKIKKLKSSPYSAMEGSKKKNPFAHFLTKKM